MHALSQARTLKPNLILLDILLPDLDGLSVCEILRLQPSTKKIPIIFMSALSGDVTKRSATMQADDFFTKPLDLNRLEKEDRRTAALRSQSELSWGKRFGGRWVFFEGEFFQIGVTFHWRVASNS